MNFVSGVSQVFLGGYNGEVNLFYNRLSLDYSHGGSLYQSNRFLESGDDKAQGLGINIPWTTGFGVGYRFNSWLNLRVEPKWHKFELLYDGASSNDVILDYTTFTLGLGLYGNIRPFKNSNNFLKGIMIAPSLRWWPRVSSSLNNDQIAYDNPFTQSTEIHKARQIGIANTPFFVNASVGYSIKLK